MGRKKKYLLTPVIIPFVVGISIGCIGYLYEVHKSENLKELIIEKDKEIETLNEKLFELDIALIEAEPFFNLEEEKRTSIKEEYYQKKKKEAQQSEVKETLRQQEIAESNEVDSYILNIESEFNEARDILDSDAENLKSSDNIRGEIAKRMKSFGTLPEPFIVVTDNMDEEEVHRAQINNILVELKQYMYDAGSGFLLHINSTDEVEQAKGSSAYIKEKGFANSQILKLEKEIEKYKSKYK